MRRCSISVRAAGPLAAVVLVLGLSAPSHADLITGLAAYYQFDGTGTDSSGNARDLSLFGDAGFAGGLFGQALDLHANNSQFAQRPVDDPGLNFGSGDFTIQIWFNFNSTPREQTLIEKFQGAGGPGWSLTTFPTALRFGVTATNGGGGILNATVSIATGTWHHVTVRSSGDTFDLFFDGAVVDTEIDSLPIEDTIRPLLIGRRNDGDGRDFSVDGRIDEVAIWNRALSDSELATLFNNGQGTPLPSAAEVPEPGTLLLTGVGGFVLLVLGYRRRQPATPSFRIKGLRVS